MSGSPKKKKIVRPIKVDQEEYKKKSAIERFSSWIESCKKLFPRYEIKEISYLGVVILAAIIKLNKVLGSVLQISLKDFVLPK